MGKQKNHRFGVGKPPKSKLKRKKGVKRRRRKRTWTQRYTAPSARGRRVVSSSRSGSRVAKEATLVVPPPAPLTQAQQTLVARAPKPRPVPEPRTIAMPAKMADAVAKYAQIAGGAA